MKWTAKLIDSADYKPVYWNLTDGKLRVTINVYKADKITLDDAKKQIKELIKKLNS